VLQQNALNTSSYYVLDAAVKALQNVTEVGVVFDKMANTIDRSEEI